MARRKRLDPALYGQVELDLWGLDDTTAQETVTVGAATPDPVPSVSDTAEMPGQIEEGADDDALSNARTHPLDPVRADESRSDPEPGRVLPDAGPAGSRAGDRADRPVGGAGPGRESYLEKVGRLGAARLRAEEIVLTDLVWISSPETSPAEAREAWELDRTSDSWLASWAERIQESPEDQMPATEELVDLAAEWMLPVTFLQALLEAEFPAQFLREHQETLAQAAERRYHHP